MAARQKPQTSPVLDNTDVDADGSDRDRIVKSLSTDDVLSIVRFIQVSPLEAVLQLRQKTHSTLKRLGVSRDPSAAIPFRRADGSITPGSIYTWLDSVDSGDKVSCEQVVAIDATCLVRGI